MSLRLCFGLLVGLMCSKMAAAFVLPKNCPSALTTDVSNFLGMCAGEVHRQAWHIRCLSGSTVLLGSDLEGTAQKQSWTISIRLSSL